MAEEQKQENTNKENTEVKETEVKQETKTPDVDVSKLIEERVGQELKKIKSSLDNAYAERDQANMKLKEIEAEKKKAEIEALEKAGKHTEILKMEMDKIKSELDSYKKMNTELSRDNAVRSHLNALDFRNDKAATMAHNDIISALKQDANGQWVHESGLSIEEAVQLYAKDEKNAFMFNVKQNAGTGTSSTIKPATGNKPVKSIKEMTSEEMLKAVADGTIKPEGTWSL